MSHFGAGRHGRVHPRQPSRAEQARESALLLNIKRTNAHPADRPSLQRDRSAQIGQLWVRKCACGGCFAAGQVINPGVRRLLDEGLVVVSAGLLAHQV
jgi:hypothetical protein